MDFLTTVLSLIVALSILIAVHEFGHYWVARRLGVKVLRFSIGFGKPIWTVRRGVDQTEYMVSSIPLGGYVKMLDEREGEVPAEEVHRAFNRQQVWKRFAIVAAGPLFNLGFAVLVLWVMLMHGIPGLKPIIGGVEPGTPAAEAGLREGMEIVAVGDTPTPTWDQVFEELLPAALHKEAIDMTVALDGQQETFRFPLDRLQGELKPDDLPAAIGLKPYQPPIPPVIHEVMDGSAAERVGLQSGDRIRAVNGAPIEDWMEMARVVRDNPGTPVSLDVERAGQRIVVQVRPERVETEEGVFGRLGASAEASPEARAMTVEVRYGPLLAIGHAIEKTWDMSSLTVRMLGRMLVGRASMDNISGPITIAQYAKTTAEAGLGYFMRFLAVVSISLGVLNLLPIPVLDGGHLMFYIVEMLKGSPISMKTELLAQKVGIAILLMLMAVAFYNDLARLAA
jgi:regulator of sigma E protease